MFLLLKDRKLYFCMCNTHGDRHSSPWRLASVDPLFAYVRKRLFKTLGPIDNWNDILLQMMNSRVKTIPQEWIYETNI